MSNPLGTRLARVEARAGLAGDCTFAAFVLLAGRLADADNRGQDPAPRDAARWAAYMADPRWAALQAAAEDRIAQWAGGDL